MREARVVLERLARGEPVEPEEAARALETLAPVKRRGGCPQVLQAKLEERNATFRALAPIISTNPNEQARVIEQRKSIYERRWMRDRESGMPPTDPLDRLFYELKRDGVHVPGLKMLRKILRAGKSN